MKLVDCYNKYKCDKGTIKHRYDRVYEPLLDSLHDREFSMLEIGIFKGNSIQAHLEYAPASHITGIDVFTRVQPENIPILNHKNVKWFKCDSTGDVVPFTDERFDVIIDDGLHTHDAQRLTFENFIPFLNDGGVYFIEDVWPFDIMTDQEKKHSWLDKHPTDWTNEKYTQLLEAISHYTVKFHDLRTGFDPDTYIIEVRK